MIQLEVKEVAEVFRSQLGYMLGPYPALLPRLTWPSVGILDALCRSFRCRTDWEEDEKMIVMGAAAHLGELVHECWSQFATDIRIEYSDGIVCSARDADGALLQVPLEEQFVTMLRTSQESLSAPGGLAFGASDVNPVEGFGLALCFGMNPTGEGLFGGLRPQDATHRAQQVVPFLAETCADHYANLHPQEPLGQHPLLYRYNLIWPQLPTHTRHPYLAAAWGIMTFLDGENIPLERAVRLLRNLAHFPSQTIRGAALTCLSLDERLPLSGDVREIAVGFFRNRASKHRAAAIRLAKQRGRNIDWLHGGENARARFQYEKQIGLLPLVYLPFDLCVDPHNRELVSALIEMQLDRASWAVESRIHQEVPALPLLLQAAMLHQLQGEPEIAENRLTKLAEGQPEQLDGEFYLAWGLCALELGQTEKVIARLEHARTIGADGLKLTSALGEAYACAGKIDEAVDAYGEGIARGQLASDALVARGKLHRGLGREELYFRDLAAAVAIDPFKPDVLEEVMATYLKM